MRRSDVAAISIADIHLSPFPPPARSKERSWYSAMDRSLGQLSDLCHEHFNPPVLIAGDIFDSWRRAPAELINFAISRLPDNCYAVPGNHDLPYHDYKNLKKSPFWTLVKADKLQLLKPTPTNIGALSIYGFGHGQEVTPPQLTHSLALNVAVVHAYIWKRDFSYHNPNDQDHFTIWQKKLKGYDIAIFGDNHKGFFAASETGLKIVNSGTFMRRISDEIKYKPFAALIRECGLVEKFYFDTSKDVMERQESSVKEDLSSLDLNPFIHELTQRNDTSLDFKEELRRAVIKETVSRRAREIVLETIE